MKMPGSLGPLLVLLGVGVAYGSVSPSHCISAQRCTSQVCKELLNVMPIDDHLPGTVVVGYRLVEAISGFDCGVNSTPGAITQCNMSGPQELCAYRETWGKEYNGCPTDHEAYPPDIKEGVTVSNSCKMLVGEWGD